MLLTQPLVRGRGSVSAHVLGPDGVWRELPTDPRRPPHHTCPQPAVCGHGAHRSPFKPSRELWEALCAGGSPQSTAPSPLPQSRGCHRPAQLIPGALARTALQVPRPCPIPVMWSLTSLFALAYFPNLPAQSSGLKLA